MGLPAAVFATLCMNICLRLSALHLARGLPSTLPEILLPSNALTQKRQLHVVTGTPCVMFAKLRDGGSIPLRNFRKQNIFIGIVARPGFRKPRTL